MPPKQDVGFFKRQMNNAKEKCLTHDKSKFPNEDQVKEIFQNYEQNETFQAFQKAKGNFRRTIQECFAGKMTKADEAAAKAELDPLEQAHIPIMENVLKDMEPYVLDNYKDIIDTPPLKTNLMKFIVIHQETPEEMAKFCQQPDIPADFGSELINNREFIREMLIHGGPSGGKWCRCYQLYKELLPMIPEGDEYTNCHKRLATAIALEHAMPIEYFNEKNVYIDPKVRLQHYIEAHKNGELDPAFGYFSTWEYRWIVDVFAREDQLQWARNYLKRYRPDQATMADMTNRYSATTGTDMTYCAPDFSPPVTFQKILSGGGMCGPYAWLARVVCKAYGTPTWGVHQPAHATFSKWTPNNGWQVLLNYPCCGWTQSYWIIQPNNEHRSGVEFKAEATARSYMFGKEEDIFRHVSLLELMGAVYGEDIKKATQLDQCPFSANYMWSSMANVVRHLWARKATPDHFVRGPSYGQPTSTTDFPNLQSWQEAYIARKEGMDTDKVTKIHESDGTIEITAISAKRHNQVHLMKCADDGSADCPIGGRGWQVHLSNKKSVVVYHLDDNNIFPPDSCMKVELSLQVCTVHKKHETNEFVVVHVNDKVVGKVTIPYTVGEWGYTSSVPITINGGDKLKLTREGNKCNGITFKRILLKPC